MPDEARTNDYEWKKIWDARIAALTPILGKPGDKVFHAIVPFQLGGFADVLPFPDYVRGATYVTAELTGEDVGQRPSSLGHYELMICTRQDLQKAADLVCKLARYTRDAVLEAGQTMELRNYFGDSTICALLFAHPQERPVQFEFLGGRYGLLLCVGITDAELAFGRSQGTGKLLALLKEHGVFPYTVPDRPSVPLPTWLACPIIRAKSRLALALVKLLQPLERQLAEYRQEIARLFEEHPDHDLFGSLPGAGPKIAPRLLSEMGSDRALFESAQSLQCYVGTAPVSFESGKVRKARVRWMCNKSFRYAVHLWADISRKSCAWASVYYKTLRARGKTHASTLRSLGQRWLKILWKMWQTNSSYDPNFHAANQLKHGSWILSINPEKTGE